MRKVFLLFSFLLILSSSHGEELTVLGYQAEAFLSAQDYVAATDIYKKMLDFPLISWQRARVLYNLGTIHLSQRRPTEALRLFHQITPNDLSMPRFGRNLLINIGIAYLQQAQEYSSIGVGIKILLAFQAFQAFQEAENMGCQEYREGDVAGSSSLCKPDPLIDQWIKTARFKINEFDQQRREIWLKEASVETLSSFLVDQLKDFSQRFKSIQEQTKSKDDPGYLLYFHRQAENFIPVWEVLQQKTFSPSQKVAFEQALNLYFRFLQEFPQGDPQTALNDLIKALEGLSFQTQSDIQYACLRYIVLAMEQQPTLSAMESLHKQLIVLKGDSKQEALLKRIAEYLQHAMREVQSNHWLEMRFFLLAGLTTVEALIDTIDPQVKKPLIILRSGLKQANRVLELTLLREMMKEEAGKQAIIIDVLKEQQQVISQIAIPFVKSVLDKQMENFREGKELASRCQQFPWEQVIPLFDQGYQSSLEAEKQLNAPLMNNQALIAHQEQTIRNWQQVLNLLAESVQAFIAPKSISGEEPSLEARTLQKQYETFRLIQEMHQEDQAKPTKKVEDLQAW